MPTYSYQCQDCSKEFELFFYIRDYIESPNCCYCKSKNTARAYSKDVLTQSASVRKADSELKTIGDIANRNRDRLSEDEKIALHNKHNEYKYETPKTELPKGMKRMKKQPKTKWY